MVSTPNGFGPGWVEAINTVMGERGLPNRIVDLDPVLWDRFIGPLCDAVEHAELDGWNLDHSTYATHPDDICEYPECDRLKLSSEDILCRFHDLLRKQHLGEGIPDQEVEKAFMED